LQGPILGLSHETANNIYAVVSGTVRATIDGHQDKLLGRGDQTLPKYLTILRLVVGKLELRVIWL